ncbi:RHS repeat-associated core domain-containing protein [Lysobacter firmicutimachus]|uniref:RHS repeat-associated core domain-containing protein n=1 Tax=Lysobacter firmicutimachus TaxID=1792846 RepID=A0AAU8MUB1_9GAMM
MSASFALRLSALVCLALAAWFVPRNARAANEYCATRYMPAQEEACFNTLSEAESYIRVEPATPIGNVFLEMTSKRQLIDGMFIRNYTVKPRAPTLVGDFYQGNFGGTWLACNKPDSTGAATAPDGTWCADEEALRTDIYRYYQREYNQTVTGAYVGNYKPSNGSWYPQEGVEDRRYVFQVQNYYSYESQARRLEIQNGAAIDSWYVTRRDWFVCPDIFYGAYAGSGVQWPLVCFNNARAEIVVRSKQFDSCCTKDGNPVVAATGNKEYREDDFDWEGQAFARTYNSIGDFDLGSGLTDHWSHSYSARLMVYEGLPNTLLRSDGYYEYLSKVNDSSYRSANRPGVVLVRESDAVAAEKGRWRLSTSSALQWFDDSGRFRAYEIGGRLYRLDYCTQADVQAGSCLAAGKLLRVRSPSGRELNFQYMAAVAAQPGDDGLRLARIGSAGAWLVEYVYDTSGRLTHASKGAAGAGEGRQYLYGESDRVCRNAAGQAIAGCNPALWGNKLTGIIDEAGQRYATYSYDELGRTTISDHALGAGKVTHAYNSNGSVTVTLPTGSSKSYYFSAEAFRQPTWIEQSTSDGSTIGVEEAFYSGNRRQWSKNGRGYRTDYSYDSFHEISRIEGRTSGQGVTPVTRTIQTDWNPGYTLPTERRTLNNANALIAKSKWTYNDRGQRLTSTQVDPATNAERTTTTSYCEAADVAAGTCPIVGLLKSVDGPRSDVADVAHYTYYASDDPACASAPATCAYRKGDLWKVADALGHVTEYLRYDASGRLLSSKDANGVVTDLEYYPRGWLKASKVRGTNAASEADDVITRYEYDLIGQVKKVIQPDGAFVRYDYDAAHRLSDIYDNAGNRIHYTVDAAGNRTQEDTRDANGVLKRTLSRIYNQLGQLKTAKTADGHPTAFTYDAAGNADLTTDALNRKTDSDYDPLNRLAKTLQDVGGINAKIEYQYDALDRLTQVNDPKGLSTTYGYNGFGDQVQLSSPDTGVTTRTFNAAGQVATKQDANDANPHTYTYDALGRPKTVSYGSGANDVEYDYDTVNAACSTGETFAVGRVTAMRTEGTELKYCYDRFGRVVRKIQSVDAQSFTLRYAYTLSGELSALTYPDGAVADYVRDAQGRIVEIGVTPAGGVRSVLLNNVGYLPFGPATGWTYGNGRSLSRTYDLDYRAKTIFDPAAGGLSLGYGYNEAGELTELKDGLQSAFLARYDYDALGRLKITRDGPTGTPLETYGYDATGNRTSLLRAGTTTTYTYPATSHRLTDVGGIARGYDAVGNTTSIGGAAKEFVYNANDRMSQVKLGGVVARSYRYNAKGERVAASNGVSGPVALYTLYDEAGHWIGDYELSGATKQQAVWLGDSPIGVLTGTNTAQKLHYVQPDHLGTPRAVVDAARNVAIWSWNAKGEAFGNDMPNQDPDQDGTAFVFDLRFPGQRYDVSTGLNYNYFRDYDPSGGRYIESDPIGLRGGISTYGYVSANPLYYFDYFGLAQSAAYPIGNGAPSNSSSNSKGWGKISGLSGLVPIARACTSPYVLGAALFLTPSNIIPSTAAKCSDDPRRERPECAANDDSYEDDEDDDPCEEWADALIAYRMSLVEKQRSQNSADFLLLVREFRKHRATFCANCPHLCNEVPPL